MFSSFPRLLGAKSGAGFCAHALERSSPLRVGSRLAWARYRHPRAVRDQPMVPLGAAEAVPVAGGQRDLRPSVFVAFDDENIGLGGRRVALDIDYRVGASVGRSGLL